MHGRQTVLPLKLDRVKLLPRNRNHNHSPSPNINTNININTNTNTNTNLSLNLLRLHWLALLPMFQLQQLPHPFNPLISLLHNLDPTLHILILVIPTSRPLKTKMHLSHRPRPLHIPEQIRMG
jgi:hypothetical protein